MAKEKAKHDGLLCFLLALIVVLILVISGGAYYFLVVDNGEEIVENKAENNSVIEENKVVEDNKTLTAQEKIDKLAKDTLLKYGEIKASASPLGTLAVLGLYDDTKTNFENLERSEDKSYFKTNIKYEDYKEKMLEIFAEEYYDIHYENYKTDEKGCLLVLDAGKSYEPTEIVSMKLIDNTNEIYTYEVNRNGIAEDGSKVEMIPEIFEFKEVNGKYVISNISEKVSISELNKIIEKVNNSEELERLTLSSIKENGNNYIITANYYMPEVITESEYIKMKTDGEITIEGKEYTFKNDEGTNAISNRGYGYIEPKKSGLGHGYLVVKTDNLYAFKYEVGGVYSTIDYIRRTVSFEVSKDMKVYEFPYNGVEENGYSLDKYAEKLTDEFLKNNKMVTINYDANNEICIMRDMR